MQIREVTEAEAAAEEEDGVEYVDFNVAGVGQQRLTLRTAVMEDKLNACTMIVEYGRPHPTSLLPGYICAAALGSQRRVCVPRACYRLYPCVRRQHRYSQVLTGTHRVRRAPTCATG